MTMKVNGYSNNLEVLKAYNSQKKPQVPKEKEPVAGAGEDTLELSVQAREMQEIQAGLRETKDVREGTVNRIKKEIEAGTYRMDARKIAEGLVKERLLDKQA